MSYKQWGNATWYLFHTLSEKLRPEYSSFSKELWNKFHIICDNLPCPNCREHAMQTMRSANTNAINTREDLIRFIWEFHNIVNASLNKPSFSKEECDNLYKRANTQRMIINFREIMKINHRIEKAMMGSFRRHRAVDELLTFIKNNYEKFNG